MATPFHYYTINTCFPQGGLLLENKPDEFEKIVYVSHPFQDKLSNLREIENIILSLKKQYPNYLFISPSHTFSFEYTYTDFETGMQYCYWLLRKCDECWVFGDWENSNGCKAEIMYCRAHNIPLCVRTGYPKIAKEESSNEIV